jgi:methylaspartate mutase S subunit
VPAAGPDLRARDEVTEHLGTIITGTVGVDAHVIGTKVISRALRDAGFKVVELGAQTPPEEFIMAAQETAADAMLISSLYGMAEIDLDGFRDKCTEAGLEDILLYVGSWAFRAATSPPTRSSSNPWGSTGYIRPKPTSERLSRTSKGTSAGDGPSVRSVPCENHPALRRFR